MHLLKAIIALALPVACLASPLAIRQSLSADLELDYLFTVQLHIGAGSSIFPAQGGYTTIQPITNGTVTGPALNGTFEQGSATPFIYNSTLTNGTLTQVQKPIITLSGTTSDGYPILVSVTGTGTQLVQVAYINVDIGGGPKYSTLRDGFIIGALNHNTNVTEVEVNVYLVNNVATFIPF